MSLAQVLRPKVPRNLHATLAASGVAFSLFLLVSWRWSWSPKRGLGLALGIVAALVFVFEMAYPARRSRARPLGNALRFLQAHVYLGAFAFVCVLLHGGLRWPEGSLGWALLLLSAWTAASGLLGVWLQKWIPAAMASGLQVEALYERIPELVEGLLGEADRLAADASDALERFYRQEVRDALAVERPSWAYLFDVRAGREAALEPFRRMRAYVPQEDKEKLEDLASIYTDKLELDAQLVLQGVLRRWLWLHVPPAGLLMGLLVVHVFAWIWY
ncbi:MAG TPA: hypothetical protein VII62_07555 [Vicinamibacteria bacterium]